MQQYCLTDSKTREVFQNLSASRRSNPNDLQQVLLFVAELQRRAAAVRMPMPSQQHALSEPSQARAATA